MSSDFSTLASSSTQMFARKKVHTDNTIQFLCLLLITEHNDYLHYLYKPKVTLDKLGIIISP